MGSSAIGEKSALRTPHSSLLTPHFRHRRTWGKTTLALLSLAALGTAGYFRQASRPPDGGRETEGAISRPADTPEEIVVSSRGEGRYTTLREAIRNAPAGSLLRVKPGVYKGGVVLDKKLEIIGDGPRAEVVVESIGCPCLDVQTDEAAVSGLTLRTRGGAFGKDSPTVTIPRGRLVLKDCDIGSARRPARTREKAP